MIKKTITYTDYNNEERTEDFYFNITRAEAAEKNMKTPGGYVEMIERVVKAKDTAALVAVFKEFILDAYGVKSADGRRFIKSKELSEEFSQTEAYNNLFMELAQDDKKASDFFNGVLPKPNTSSIPAPADK